MKMLNLQYESRLSRTLFGRKVSRNTVLAIPCTSIETDIPSHSSSLITIAASVYVVIVCVTVLHGGSNEIVGLILAKSEYMICLGVAYLCVQVNELYGPVNIIYLNMKRLGLT